MSRTDCFEPSESEPSESEPSEVRSRLVAGISKAAGEQGYANLDLARAARHAGLTAEDIGRHFGSAEQALLAAQTTFLRRLWLEISAACGEAEAWPEKVRASVGAGISTLVEASDLARVFAIEAPGASLAAADLQFAAMGRLAVLLREGRDRYPRAANLPEATERMLIGGAVSLVSEHLLAEDPQMLPRLQPELVELLLTPYLGEREAGRVAREA